MVAVRKPGRPLSSCPHQKGKPCTCNNITAAIPRNAQCECGTPAPITAPTKAVVKTEPTASDIAPRSPMSPTKMTSFRVQKPTTTKPPIRKQSYDVSRLGQMDPNVINMMPSQNLPLGTNGNIGQVGSVPSPDLMSNVQPSFSSGISLGPQFEFEKILESANGTALNTFFETSHGPMFDLPSNGLASNETLGHPSLVTISTPHYTLTPRSLSSGSRTNGSCCAKNSAAIKPAHEELESEAQPQDALGLIGYGNSLAAHDTTVPTLEFDTTINGTSTINHTPQSAAYTFPVQYGSSFYEPLQFSQWQEMMASQSPGIPPLNSYVAPHSGIEASTAVSGSYAAHQCFCGEGCQCLGCATHPFNSAMQEYVLSAIQDEHELSPKSDGESNGITKTTNETPPAIVPSPSADASPVTDAGSTAINEYLFVAYCPGNPQSCPCGDECACVGCMIHGDTGPGTPVTPH
ncbi:hypothetical protein F4861DRAFT_465467 [Xylaria intraflava]|nr:hypothetical protein F4861DRAFT_465467 [Xylaria intraflava]